MRKIFFYFPEYGEFFKPAVRGVDSAKALWSAPARRRFMERGLDVYPTLWDDVPTHVDSRLDRRPATFKKRRLADALPE